MKSEKYRNTEIVFFTYKNKMGKKEIIGVYKYKKRYNSPIILPDRNFVYGKTKKEVFEKIKKIIDKLKYKEKKWVEKEIKEYEKHERKLKKKMTKEQWKYYKTHDAYGNPLYSSIDVLDKIEKINYYKKKKKRGI